MKNAVFIVCIHLSFFLCAQTSEKSWSHEVNGYVKSMQGVVYFEQLSVISPYLMDNLLHNRLNYSARHKSGLRFNASLRNRVFWGDLVRLNRNFGQSIEEGNNDSWDLSYHLIHKDSWLLNSTLDRLNLQFNGEYFDITLGRQRINWGIHTFWNPNDLYNAYNFTDFDYEERPGSDAFHFQYYTGNFSSIELASNYFENWNDAIVAAKINFNWKGYDFQMLGGWHRQDLMVGFGWAGNVKNASWKGEVSYFSSTLGDENNALIVSTGVEYVFDSGLFFGAGLLYNDKGNLDQGLSQLLNFELSPKNIYPYRWSIYTSGQWSLTPLMSMGVSLVYSPVEVHPLFVSPVISYSIGTDWDIDLVSQVLLDKAEDFDLRGVLGYLRLKWSF